MHVSPCHPRSSIFRTPTAIPALIFAASKPGGREGSEKSTVSGFWPTKRMRVIGFLHGSDQGIGGPGASVTGPYVSEGTRRQHQVPRLRRGADEAGWEHVHHALPHVKFRGRPQNGPQGRDRQRSPEDDCSLRSLDASYAELTASFAALRLFRGNMMSRQTSGWTSISSVSLPCLEAAAPKARVDPLRAGSQQLLIC